MYSQQNTFFSPLFFFFCSQTPFKFPDKDAMSDITTRTVVVRQTCVFILRLLCVDLLHVCRRVARLASVFARTVAIDTT